MRKLKCTSCGAELKIDDNKEYAVCEHCRSKYKLNEDLNINIKLDDNVKDILNTGMGVAKGFSKFMFLPIIVFVIIFISIIFFAIKSESDFNKEQQKSKEEYAERTKKQKEESDKYNFNFQFINSNGTKSKFLLGYILDDVIESNKTHDRQVKLVFNGKATKDENEILDIKHNLEEDAQYEVSLNYKDGYINEIKVDKIG